MTPVHGHRDPRFAVRVAEKWLRDEGFTSLPVDPRVVAARLEITVQPKPDTAPGVSGMLLRHGNSFGILYATHVLSEGFQNFSIAHEIGHYLLDGHPEHVFQDGSSMHTSHAGFVSLDPFEAEADHFAAGLLMPDPMFTRALRRAGDGLDAIEALASLCRTSLTATGIRYVQCADVPVAVVMSTGDRIDYCFMSKALQDFPDLTWPRKGDLLPGGVATERFNSDQRNVTEGRRQQAKDNLRRWFGSVRHIETTEDVLGLGSYGKTLTVIRTETFADDEEEEDDESLADRWTPRFHR